MISKKGFTLIEMLAVIVIIAIIMALVLPTATRVRNNNKTRIYKEYESMMVEYAKVNELNYQDSIDLIDLDELEKVKNECSGYVEIDHSTNPPTYASFITCGDEYTTDNYDRTYAKTIIAVPECKSGLIYNGNNQNLVASNEGYAISNGVRKDAGKQDVTLTINDTSTYIWADATSTPKVVRNCEIAKREVTIKADNLTMSYSNSTPSYSYTMSNAINGDNPISGSISYNITDENNNPVTINETTPVGVYVIKPTGTPNSNYKFKLENGILILLRSVLTVPTCESKVYTGATQTLFEAHTTGSYTNSAITGIDSGNYTGTLTQNNNYQWDNDHPNEPVTMTCTITPKSVPVTWGSTTAFAYNGSAQAPTASATGVSGETINVTRTTQTNASTTSYTSTASCSSVTGGRAKCSNYTLTGTTKSFMINKAACTLGVTATQSWSTTFSTSAQTKAISLATGGKGTVTYAINSQKNSSGTTVNNFSISNTTLSMNASTGAGTYTVVIRVTDTGNTNYSGCNKDITMTVTVGKATNPIAVTATQSVSATYSTSNQDKSFTAATNAQGSVTYSIQSQKNSSGTTVSSFSIPTSSAATLRIAASTAVGTYTVVVRATAAGNSNYNSGYKDITITVTVGKAGNPIAVTASQSWSASFSTSAQTKAITAATGAQGTVTYAINSQPSGNYFSISGSTLTMKASTPAGSYSVVVRATAAGNSNYNSGYKDITMTVTVGKVDAVCPTISDWTGPYDGAQHSINVSGGSGGSIQYRWNSTTEAWRDTKPTASIVGSWKVYVQVKGDSNHNTKDCGYKTVTINKATNPIAVTASQSWSSTFSTSAQTKAITAATSAQGTVTYAIQSQKNSSGTAVNKFSISSTTLTMAASTNAGTYTVVIRATAAGNSNYNSGYKDITVTVTVGRQGINFPTCNSKLYTGKKQTLWAAETGGNGYTNSILQGVFVGSYSVTLTPTSNYQWNGGSNVTSGRTLTCSIAGTNRWECYYVNSNNQIVSCDGDPHNSPSLTSQRWAYYNSSGTRVQSGWVQTGDSALNPDSNSKKHWYYFSGGYAHLGWYQDSSDNCWYYLSTFDDPGGTPNGAVDAAALTSTTETINGESYSFSVNGRCYQGSGCSSSCNH